MGIRAKLVLCLLAVLIPLGAVSAFALQMFDRQLTERTESALANTQRLEVARINETLSGYAQYARSLASDSHVKDFVSQIHAYRTARRTGESISDVRHPIGGQDGFALIDPEAPWPLQQLALSLQSKAGFIGSSAAELRLVDREGNILGESVGFSWKPADPLLAERAMRTVKTMFGDAFRNDNDQRRLGLISPISNLSGEVVGALLLETRLGPIVDLIAKHESLADSSEAHIVQPLINGDAQFITPLRFDRQAAFRKVVARTSKLPIIQSLDATDARIVRSKDYRGVPSILSIKTIPATGWGLVIKIDEAEAYEPTIGLRTVLVYAAFTSLIVILAGYLFCLVPIARRIKRTAAAAQKIMQGDLTTRICDTANDEIGEMARTIDSLAKDLEEDQSMRTEVEARLRHQALHDELTGLLNRKYANKVIEQLNEDTRAHHSVMFLDLNGFKDVNDLYGHAAGDEVLVQVAGRLTSEILQGQTLARWGGDEFVVILPGTDEKSATQFALTLHNAFDEPITTSQGIHKISCSIGLATSSETKSLEDVLMEADSLMYEQKKRQHESRSTGGMATRTVERALHDDHVEVWMQPIVRFRGPKECTLIGAEAHLRIRTTEGGVILPSQFIADLHGNSLVTALDRRVMFLSFLALSRWTLAGVVSKSFKLTLTVDNQTLVDPDFYDVFSCQVEAASVRADQIVLTIPRETTAEPSMLARLKSMGVQIALASVNAEPSTLGLLTQLQPDIAKVDRQWLTDPIIAPHLIAICKERHLNVEVGSMEDRQEVSRFYELGITDFQGPLFDGPLRTVDFIRKWGKSSLRSKGQQPEQPLALRLAG